jgi:intracellular sulfur oxidation DsrE/DsrF family protein
MRNSLAAYSDPLGFAAGPNSLNMAAVFYGGYSYAISLDDAMYDKYPIASLVDGEMHPGDSTYAKAAKSLRRNLDSERYSALVADHDVSFFICNNALSGFAYVVARAVTPAGSPVVRGTVVAIRDEMVQHVLPGTMLVPAGVAALNALQEAGFTFLPE